MRILISGADGFIGRAVMACARAKGHEVLAWDDIPADHGRLRSVQAVIHLAGRYPVVGRTTPSARELVEANTALTAAVLDACQRAQAAPRIVFASTAAVYGPQPDAPLAEHAPPRPAGAYGASKLGAEALLQAASGPHVSLRLFNVYGPDQPRGNVFDTIAAQFDESGPVRVLDLRPVRDFIHVDDVARAFVAAATHPAPLPPVINIGSGQGTPVAALARCILDAAGQSRPVESTLALEGQSRDRAVADVSLAGSALGWTPSIDLAQGVADTLARDPHYRISLERLRHAAH